MARLQLDKTNKITVNIPVSEVIVVRRSDCDCEGLALGESDMGITLSDGGQ